MGLALLLTTRLKEFAALSDSAECRRVSAYSLTTTVRTPITGSVFPSVA
jgi:hypothetical protein